MLDGAHLRVLDLYQAAALDTGLPGVAPLGIAGKHDPRVPADQLVAVDVSQGPVLVAAGLQPAQAAGGIGLVPRAPVERGVKQADVEEVRMGEAVGKGQIVGDRAGRESLAVDSDGRPIISYDSGQGGLRLAQRRGGPWQSEGMATAKGSSSLALDAQGRPHLAYFAGNTQGLVHAQPQGEGWQQQTIAVSPDVGRRPSMAVDGEGRLGH